MAHFTGTSGNNSHSGTADHDMFDLSQGGEDTVDTGDGDDTIMMGAALDAGDRIQGGTGFDTLVLDGAYASDINFDGVAVSGIEQVRLTAGNIFHININAGAVASGETMVIDGSTLAVGDFMNINAGSLTGAAVKILGGAASDIISGSADGHDILNGGEGNDTIYGGFSARQNIDGGAGDDNISAGVEDRVIGGDGNDTIALTTSTAHTVVLQMVDAGAGDDDVSLSFARIGDGALHGGDGVDSLSLDNVVLDMDVFDVSIGFEKLSLGDVHGTDADNWFDLSGFELAGTADGYSLSGEGGDDIIVGLMGDSGTLLGEDGDDMLVGQGLNDTLKGGEGSDHLVGRRGDDNLTGGAGGDSMRSGLGNDTFNFSAVSESSSTDFDYIRGFNALRDKIVIGTAVAAIDTAITTGSLAAHTFDTDLAAAVDATHLLAHDAVLFTPDAGKFAGHTFIVVDANGTAGYQAGEDWVFEIKNMHNAADLDIGDFLLT